MERPYKYTIIDNLRNITETNIEPLLHQLQTWEYLDEKTRVKVQTKTCWEDMRYEAKLRLFNYLTYTKNGLKIPAYKPFEGTEIGVSIPILNF